MENNNEEEVVEYEDIPFVVLMNKSFLAGIIISISGYIFVNVENKYIGALLFSVGLLTILMLELILCTGRFCYRYNGFGYLFFVILFNLLGSSVLALLINLSGKDISKIKEIAINKINKPIPELLLDAILCGILIGIAVLGYKVTHNIFIVLLAVMSFILIGAEHVVANMFYIASCITDSAIGSKSLLFLGINLVGNFLGGKITSYICE